MAEPTGQATSFGLRNFISKNSKHFQPESGRYHLYVSYACPFAHRALLSRKLKGLEDHIGLSVTHPVFQKTKPGVDEHLGWTFKSENDEPIQTASGHGSFSCKGCTPDTVNNAKTIRELYDISNNATPKYSVPVLWDKKNKTIVNNDSGEILRMFGTTFNDLAKNPSLDLYPEDLRANIDQTNEWINNELTTEVYKCVLAQKQEDYDKAFNTVFNALDRIEDILSKNRYVCGNRLTETDLRLFPSLLRFDEVYHGHFRCNRKKIIDYPNMINYCREIYQIPGVADTINMDHVKNGYYANFSLTNPYGIVAVGPDFMSTLKEKHNRDTLA